MREWYCNVLFHQSWRSRSCYVGWIASFPLTYSSWTNVYLIIFLGQVWIIEHQQAFISTCSKLVWTNLWKRKNAKIASGQNMEISRGRVAFTKVDFLLWHWTRNVKVRHDLLISDLRVRLRCIESFEGVEPE